MRTHLGDCVYRKFPNRHQSSVTVKVTPVLAVHREGLGGASEVKAMHASFCVHMEGPAFMGLRK